MDRQLREQLELLTESIDELADRLDEMRDWNKPTLDLMVQVHMRLQAVLTLLLEQHGREPPP